MTARELVERLAAMPADAVVWIDVDDYAVRVESVEFVHMPAVMGPAPAVVLS